MEEIYAVNIDLTKISAFFQWNGLDCRELSCDLLQTSNGNIQCIKTLWRPFWFFPPRYGCLGTRGNTMFYYVTTKIIFTPKAKRHGLNMKPEPYINKYVVTTRTKPWDNFNWISQNYYLNESIKFLLNTDDNRHSLQVGCKMVPVHNLYRLTTRPAMKEKIWIKTYNSMQYARSGEGKAVITTQDILSLWQQ